MKNKKSKIIALSVSGFVLALGVTVNVLALSTFDHLITERLIGYDVDEETAAANRASGEALAEEIVKDGVVLLKNDEIETGVKSLPLSEEVTKVNVFGWSSTQWIGGGSGSGRVVNSTGGLKVETDFLGALTEYGIEYNTELTEFYKDFCGARPKYSDGTLNSWAYEYHRLIEPEFSEYSDELLENAANYSDTAIVVLGRVGGESSDVPKVQYKGTGTSKNPDDESRTYLEISTEEEELLEYVGASYDNVVVLINALNTMELGFMETIDGLDSCLLVGGTGTNAAKALPSVLYGKDKEGNAVSPSGRVTDTFAYEFESNPTYANAGLEGENVYTNATDKKYYPNNDMYTNVTPDVKYPGLSYVDYAESVYVGYKWYETAYAEGYYDNASSDYGDGYDGVVQYPFGYGLSYSEQFDWEIVGLSHKNNAVLAADDTIEVTVRVTNKGTVPAKDVVELYYTPQYYEGEIEKAYVNLAAFAKTPELEPGKYADVKLSFDVEDMASYDCYNANNNDYTGYEIDEGTYEIKLMKNAHELHDITVSNYSEHDTAVVSYRVDHDIYYQNYKGSEVTVDNKFTGEGAIDGAPIDGSSHDGSEESPITYLTRADFEGTFPEHQEAREITEEQLEYNLYTTDHAAAWQEANEENYDSDIVTGANYGLTVFENGMITETGLELGGDYDHEDWDSLLDQMTMNEMKKLVLHGYCHTEAVASIGKPKTIEYDGPAQVGSFNAASSFIGVGYPNATVLAQTWNSDTSYDFGIAMGTEAKTRGVDAIYGPGMNLHRSPFGGRNYEYYSEDAYLSGMMGANTVKAMKNAGVYCYLKHLAVYDQEAYRDSLYTWLTEQAFREIYLKPFHMTVVDGGATGIMTSYNRLGGVWVGGSSALLEHVVRDEWDFKGTILTDYADHHNYMSMDHALRNGGDLWMDGYANNGSFKMETTSRSFQHAIRRASKNIIYTFLNAYYANDAYNKAIAENPDLDAPQITIGTKGELDESWKTWVYVADAVIVAGLAAWITLTFLKKDKSVEADVE